MRHKYDTQCLLWAESRFKIFSTCPGEGAGGGQSCQRIKTLLWTIMFQLVLIPCQQDEVWQVYSSRQNAVPSYIQDKIITTHANKHENMRRLSYITQCLFKKLLALRCIVSDPIHHDMMIYGCYVFRPVGKRANVCPI